MLFCLSLTWKFLFHDWLIMNITYVAKMKGQQKVSLHVTLMRENLLGRWEMKYNNIWKS